MTEEDFLSDLYNEFYDEGGERLKVASFIDSKVIWRYPGSTTKIKRLIALVLNNQRYYPWEGASSLISVKPNTELHSLFEECLNRITEFQKTNYTKGNGRGGEL